jgi:hypothetical protein
MIVDSIKNQKEEYLGQVLNQLSIFIVNVMDAYEDDYMPAEEGIKIRESLISSIDSILDVLDDSSLKKLGYERV